LFGFCDDVCLCEEQRPFQALRCSKAVERSESNQFDAAVEWCTERKRMSVMGMLMRWADERAKKGQSVMEYSILLVVVATALMGMGLYVRRAVQGKLYAIDDQISPRPNALVGEWSPPI
jgi:hypothetical protein